MLVALLAGGLAVWIHLFVPYDRQLRAKKILEPFTQEMQSIPAKPVMLSRVDPERFFRIIQLRSRSWELNDETIAPIASMPFIHRLYLNRTHVGDQGLIHIGQLPQLQRLSLWHSHITDEGLVALRHCQNLEALDIHATGVSDDGMKHLTRLGKLRELTVGAGVCGPGLKAIASMPNLVRLDLSRSGVRFENVHWLAGSGIEELKFIPRFPAGSCGVLVELPNLRRFDSQVVHADDATAAVISRCRKLESVDVAGVGLTDEATRLLTRMPALTQLRMHGALTDQTLAIVGGSKQLRQVDLSGRFSQQAIKRLSSRRPDLSIKIRSVIAEHLDVADLPNVNFTSLIDVNRLTTQYRVSIHWPATLADFGTLPLAIGVRALEVRLMDPPTLSSAYRSDFQREWSLDGVEKLAAVKWFHVPRARPDQLGRFADFPALQELILDDDRLTDAELDQLKLPTGLLRLVIVPCAVSRAGLERLQQRYPQVAMRVNGHGSIYDDGTRWQAPWSGQGSIDDIVTYPDLEVVQIEDIRRTLDLSKLASLSNLEEISLRGSVSHAPIWTSEEELPQVEIFRCNARSFDNAQIQQLAQMPSLESILLRRSMITDRGLAVLRHTPKLKEIDFGAEWITGSGFKHLAQCQDLWRIEIQSTAIKDRHIEHLQELENLRELEIRNTQLGDLACKHFSRIPNLETLHLSDTQITDEGLRWLGTSPKLRTLFIRSTRVTDTGLWELAKCPSLRAVYVRGGASQVTPQGIYRVQAAHPHLKIE